METDYRLGAHIGRKSHIIGFYMVQLNIDTFVNINNMLMVKILQM